MAHSPTWQIAAIVSPSACTKHGRKLFFGVEIFLSKFTGGAHMLRIVSVDLCHAGKRFFEVIEAQQAAAGGEVLAKACVLGEYWSTTCEIAGATVAKPAGLEMFVNWLRAAKLRA